MAYRAVYLTQDDYDPIDLLDCLEGLASTWAKQAATACGWKKCTPVLCMSLFKTPNFRHLLYPDYKKSRRTRETPEYLPMAYDFIYEKELDYPVYKFHGLEADDIMGILATKFPKDSVIVTVDKDLKSIPGNHWNPVKETFENISVKAADYNFCTQWLTGDATDCVPGVPKIGPKKAAKILDKSKDLQTTVLKTYEDHGLTYDYALTMGRLVRILRAGDCEEISKDGITWSPWTPLSTHSW